MVEISYHIFQVEPTYTCSRALMMWSELITIMQNLCHGYVLIIGPNMILEKPYKHHEIVAQMVKIIAKYISNV